MEFTALIDELLEDLTEELEPTDIDFNEDVLQAKIKNAIKEVVRARRYPSGYSEEMILNDVDKFYSNIRNIAMYDYNQIGVEGQAVHLENETRREYVSRDKLFYGINPFASF